MIGLVIREYSQGLWKGQMEVLEMRTPDHPQQCHVNMARPLRGHMVEGILDVHSTAWLKILGASAF